MISGSLNSVADPIDEQPGHPRQQQQHHGGHGDEHHEKKPVAGEQPAQGQDGAEVGDKAGGQDQLAKVLPVEAGLDHHRVHHGHGGGAQGDTADLGSMEGPVQSQQTEGERARKRQRKRDDADGQARLPVAAQRDWIDLRARQEGQKHRAHVGEEAGECRLLDVRSNAGDVAEHGTDHDLHQSHGDAEADADQRRGERHADPDRGDEVVVHREPPAWAGRGLARVAPTRRLGPGRSHQPARPAVQGASFIAPGHSISGATAPAPGRSGFAG